MKQILFAASVFLTTAVFAQKQEPVKKQEPASVQQPSKDTVQKIYILPGDQKSFDYLLNVLAQSKLELGGEQLNYVKVNALLTWIKSAQLMPPSKPEDPAVKPKGKH